MTHVAGACVLALLRYRAMVPVLFVVLLFEHLARRLVAIALPISRAAEGPSTGTIINSALFLVMLAGVVLSLVGRDNASQLRRARREEPTRNPE